MTLTSYDVILSKHLIKFCHNPDTELGENIFSSWSSDPAALARLRGADPVDSWYKEITMFK